MKSLIAFILTCSLVCSSNSQIEDPLRYVLDGMQEMMEGGDSPFDDDFYSSLTDCLDLVGGDRLLDAHSAAWAAMMAAAEMGGVADDEWLDCQELEDMGSTGKDKWVEFNCTLQEKGQLPIYEPCDYASNVAYFHTAVEICHREDWSLPAEYVHGIAKTFTWSTYGSGFYHGSQTGLGKQVDHAAENLFIFAIYQAAVSQLQPLESAVIHDLSQTPREMKSFEFADKFEDIVLEMELTQWEEEFKSLDIPNIHDGFCAMIVTSLALVLDSETLQNVSDLIVEILQFQEQTVFCLEELLPAIDQATEHIVLEGEDYDLMVKSTLGVVIKLVYGMFWQEDMLPDQDWMFSEEGNEAGAELLPVVNTLTNLLLLPSSDFPHADPDFQLGQGVFPGVEWCSPAPYPHSKWHMQTGIAMVDMAHLGDLIYRFIS